MNKFIRAALPALLICALLAGCAPAAGGGVKTGGKITVVSREEGSGTRSAFVELLGVLQKDAAGNKNDMTSKSALVSNTTNVMLTQVSGDKNAIGYVSMGSLQKTVKALKLDGVAATGENVKNGTYKASRPFNIVTKGAPEGLARDFIDFILSAQGQKIVEKAGYITAVDIAPDFAGTKPAGKLTVAGSSSVTPVMEKLAEGYMALNSAATIEVQQSDSSAGVKAVGDGTAQIGMVSREVTEKEKGTVTPIVIAKDGIAIIVNNENPITDIKKDDVTQIFTGSKTSWDGIGK